MNRSTKDTKDVLTDIPSFIKDMKLPVKSQVEGRRRATVYSEAIMDFHTVDIQVTYFKDHGVLGIRLTSWHTVGEDRIMRLISFLNYINSIFMDIGCFCLQPVTGKVTLRTGYGVIEGRIDKDQFTQTLCRLISQAYRGFQFTARAVFEAVSIEEVINDELRRMGSRETAPHCAYITDHIN